MIAKKIEENHVYFGGIWIAFSFSKREQTMNIQNHARSKWVLMGIVLLVMILATTSVHGATSNYPISWITFPNAYIGANSNSETCDGGLVHRLTCKFRSFGANGVGTFSGKDNLNNHLTVTISSIENAEGFSLKTEAWIDHTTRDGTNNRKFFLYLSSQDGKRGYVEFLPDLMNSTPEWSIITEALILDWNAENSERKTMSLQLEKLNDDSSISWNNRSWALRIELESNEVLNETMMALAIDQGDGDDHNAYQLRVIRNSRHTLVNGTRYVENRRAARMEGVAQGYECVRNSDIEILAEAENSDDLLENYGGVCSVRGASALESISVNEENLNVFAKMALAGWF